MPERIQGLIIVTLFAPAVAYLQSLIAIIGFVDQKVIRRQAPDQGLGLCTVCDSSGRDFQTHRQAMTVHSNMEPGVQATFGATRILVSPFAPAACG